MSAAAITSLGSRIYDNTRLALFLRLIVNVIVAGRFLLGGIYGICVESFPCQGRRETVPLNAEV